MDEGWNFPGYTVLLAVLVAGVEPAARGGDLRETWAVRQGGTGSHGALDHPQSGGRTVGAAVCRRAEFPLLRPLWFARGRGRFGTGPDRTVRVGSVLAPPSGSGRSDFGRATVGRQRWMARRPFVSRLGGARPLRLRGSNGSRVSRRTFAWPHLRCRSPMRHRSTGGAAAPSRGSPCIGTQRSMAAIMRFFEGDLRLLGGSYERINPAGLRFVASLGYETLAFHRDYLAANSWIETLPWLDRIDEREEWRFFQTNHDFSRFPVTSLEQIVARGDREEQPASEVPPNCWITGSWPVAEDVIVADSDWALLAWTDEHGRIVAEPKPAFYQHIFGPSIPAYTVRTPRRPGRYRLVVLDRGNHPRAAKTYQIVSNLTVSQPDFPARRPGVTVHSAVLQPMNSGPDRSSVALTLR